MNTFIAFLLGLAGLGSVEGGAPSRAERNYQRLLAGDVQWAALTPIERAEIVELARVLRSIPADRASEAERCWRDGLRRTGPPSALAEQLIKLRCGSRPEAREPQAD